MVFGMGRGTDGGCGLWVQSGCCFWHQIVCDEMMRRGDDENEEMMKR